MAEINDLDIVDANNTARFPENMAPSAVDGGARALEGIVARWHKDINGSVASTGSANAYVVAANQTLSAYYDGLMVTFDANFANTGAATLNVDGLGADSIVWPDGNGLISGDIPSGAKVTVLHDGTNWQLITPTKPQTAVPSGYLSGMILSNHTDTDHDISVSTGVCRDADDLQTLRLTSAIVKQIDANWAEGSAAGGFPSGLTLSASTFYHFFVIWKTDGTVDGGFDTSLTATNLLADATAYSRYRRLGTVVTGIGSNINRFEQDGDYFWYADIKLNVNDTTPGTTANTATITVPPDVVTHAIMNWSLNHSAAVNVLVTSLGQDDVAASATVHTLQVATESERNSTQIIVKSNASRQIRYRSDTSSVDSLIGQTMGYIDSRGRNG